MKKRIAKIVIVWLVYYLLVELPLMIVGIPIVGYLVLNKRWRTRMSREYIDDRIITTWNAGAWSWFFGNEEDGIDGLPCSVIEGGGAWAIDPRQYWWRDKTKGWSVGRRIFVWAALRNSVSNLRYTKFGVKIDPQRIDFYNFPAFPNGPDLDPVYARWWCWQGLRGRIHYETKRFVLEIGWKLRPEDSRGVAPDDTRLPGAGFGLRLKRRK